MRNKMSGPFRLSNSKPDKLVIFLHGVGSDGYDLIGLSEEIEEVLPNTVFLSPNAPFPYDEFPAGYQWFSLRDRSEDKLYQGIQTAMPILKDYIDENLEKHQLSYKDLVLIGFSQGAMMALQMALSFKQSPFAVIGFSGALIKPEALSEQLNCKPAVFLCHGDMDQVVPIEKHYYSMRHLKAMNIPAQEYLMKETGHSISAEGLIAAKNFLKAQLKI